MSLTLIGGRLLVERKPGRHRLGEPVDITVHDGLITAISAHEPGRAVSGERLDIAGMLVLPGLVNGHMHSHENLHKARYETMPLEVYMNYLRPPFPMPTLTAEEVYYRTMLGAIESLRGGATTVVDDANFFPELRDDHIDAVFRAYEDSGIRAFVGVSMFDKHYFRAVPFVEEEMPPAMFAEFASRPPQDAKRLLELAAELMKSRHPRDRRVGFVAAPSAPQRCSDGFLADLFSLAKQESVPAIIHVHESRLQAVTAQLNYGKTMIAHLDDLGCLGPQVTLIHAVWLRPDDLARLAAAGATVQHNPVCNLRVGSGIMPVAALFDAGVNVSLGSDGCGSSTVLNMLHTAGLAAMLNNIRGRPATWVGAKAAWIMGTVNGARPFGLDGVIGRIAPGYRADLVCYRTTGVGFTPLHDPLQHVVYGERGQSIDTVLVDGRVVLRGGRFTTVDEEAVFARVREIHARLLPDLDRCETKGDEIASIYQRIWDRCEAMAIPDDTFPARLRDPT